MKKTRATFYFGVLSLMAIGCLGMIFEFFYTPYRNKVEAEDVADVQQLAFWIMGYQGEHPSGPHPDLKMLINTHRVINERAAVKLLRASDRDEVTFTPAAPDGLVFVWRRSGSELRISRYGEVGLVK